MIASWVMGDDILITSTRNEMVEEIDREWMMLMEDARRLGVSPDEVRRFLDRQSILVDLIIRPAPAADGDSR